MTLKMESMQVPNKMVLLELDNGETAAPRLESKSLLPTPVKQLVNMIFDIGK